MARLSGQVAIVTGGGQGIGGATARRLAEDGARVLIADVDDAAATDNAARIQAAGGEAATRHTDINRPEDIRAMVQDAVDRWGTLTILVNNAYSAAPGARGSALEVEPDAWRAGMATMIDAMYHGVRESVPHMRQAGGGSIVSLSSVHGLMMAPGALVYEAGKSAIIGMTRQMACDFGPMGIRVNAICPGHIVTERMEQRWGENQAGLRFFEQQYPLRRTGKPVDIANAIAFLCSDEASFITGQAIAVDGGLTIQLQENLGVHLAHWVQANPDTKMPY